MPLVLVQALAVMRRAVRPSRQYAEWIADQVTEALSWAEASKHLIPDRSCIFDAAHTPPHSCYGLSGHPTVPRPPWHNGHTELPIASIRRDCPRPVVVLGEGPASGPQAYAATPRAPDGSVVE